MVGVDDVKGLLEQNQFHDSMIVRLAVFLQEEETLSAVAAVPRHCCSTPRSSALTAKTKSQLESQPFH